MELLPILQRYHATFLQQYAARLSPEQHQALHAMLDCRTQRFGEMQLYCNACQFSQSAFHSCGHRACARCQHHENSRWLLRQQIKLLPVNYFMVTFTLPYQLRALAFAHQKELFSLLFECAVSTLKTFVKNDKHLGHDIGLTAVLHTHSRQLEFHPHVHLIVPAGCFNKKSQQWKHQRDKYLFHEFNLACVFRARFLEALRAAGFSLPPHMPKTWVANCEFIGSGLPALKYLSRYLYRGVISEKNILRDDGSCVTFRYQENKSKQWRTRTLNGEDFLWLLLQHVLPKGFRRVRDFGFLHGNARRLLLLIQRQLRVNIPAQTTDSDLPRPCFRCVRCQQPMAIVRFIRPLHRAG
jgi:hypothetical protein